ncbi:hypothetical protein D3C74_354170 [compost metagenome]
MHPAQIKLCHHMLSRNPLQPDVDDGLPVDLLELKVMVVVAVLQPCCPYHPGSLFKEWNQSQHIVQRRLLRKRRRRCDEILQPNLPGIFDLSG